jgi:hypothetical protein
MKKPFVPQDFQVPETLETNLFRLRTLTVHDVVKDYDAVMTSVDHLQGVFGSHRDWPQGLTFEQDLIDLGWHQKEFQRRSSFTYTVMSLDESRCLGCVYIYPPSRGDFEAEVYLWVRQSEVGKGLDEVLFNTVKKWIQEKWSFAKVAHPGREISWSDWMKMDL